MSTTKSTEKKNNDMKKYLHLIQIRHMELLKELAGEMSEKAGNRIETSDLVRIAITRFLRDNKKID